MSDHRLEWFTQVPKTKVLMNRLKSAVVSEHPLQGKSATSFSVKGPTKVNDSISKMQSSTQDPLMRALDGADPLSAMAAQTDWDEYNTEKKTKNVRKKTDPWDDQKQIILSKYTTTKKLSMAIGIIAGLDRSSAAIAKELKEPNKEQPTTIRHRLEQLDEEFENVGPKEVAFYSQQEFGENVKELCSELTRAWHQDFRVKALKIAIQCSKLLVDTAVVQFYPSKFVQTTDVLDEFGHLVYERLWSKSDSGKPHELIVSESAKETCRNWFYKIASIRELIPRLYVEAAVLKSYNFLDNCEFSSALRRLVTMVRGIGDPLVAVFTRCYLVRIAMSVENPDKQLMKENFSDFLKTYGQFGNGWESSWSYSRPPCLIRAGMTIRKLAMVGQENAENSRSRILYIQKRVWESLGTLNAFLMVSVILTIQSLFSDILCTEDEADENLTMTIPTHYQDLFLRLDDIGSWMVSYSFLDLKDQTEVAAILSNGVLSELNKNKVDVSIYLQSYVPAVEWMLVNLVKDSNDKAKDEIVEACCCIPNKGLLLYCILKTFDADYISRKSLYFARQIESCANEHFPLHMLLSLLGNNLKGKSIADSKEVLEEGLAIISQLIEPSDYLSCIISWNSFIISNSTVVGLNTLLEDVIAHISVGDKKTFYGPLQDIILSIATNVSNIDILFTMDKFLPLLDVFGSDEMKSQTARRILDILGANHEQYSTTDPVTINSLIFLAKILHDSVNVLTVEDERRQIGNLISHIIRKIDFGMDFEKQLSFYVDARATFTNLDSVTSTLVHCVNQLAMETGKKVRGQHTKNTSSFVHACAAYSFITIPSIRSDTSKLQLYLSTTQVSLTNQCLGQADACIKAAITLIADLPLKYEVDGVMKSNEPFIQEYVKGVLSTLLVLPDCPEQGILYVTRILVNVLQKYSDENNLGLITGLYLHVMDLLAAYAQPDYAYHVKGVDSNDVLYGSDPKVLSEINKMCTVLLEQTLGNLQKLGAREEYKKQSNLSFGLFMRLIHHADLDAPGMSTRALQLWKLSIKRGCLDSKLLRNTVSFVKSRSNRCAPKCALPVLALQLEGTLQELK